MRSYVPAELMNPTSHGSDPGQLWKTKWKTAQIEEGGFILLLPAIAPPGCDANTAARACVALRISGDTFWSATILKIDFVWLEASAFVYIHSIRFQPFSANSVEIEPQLNTVPQMCASLFLFQTVHLVTLHVSAGSDSAAVFGKHGNDNDCRSKHRKQQ